MSDATDVLLESRRWLIESATQDATGVKPLHLLALRCVLLDRFSQPLERSAFLDLVSDRQSWNTYMRFALDTMPASDELLGYPGQFASNYESRVELLNEFFVKLDELTSMDSRERTMWYQLAERWNGYSEPERRLTRGVSELRIAIARCYADRLLDDVGPLAVSQYWENLLAPRHPALDSESKAMIQLVRHVLRTRQGRQPPTDPREGQGDRPQ